MGLCNYCAMNLAKKELDGSKLKFVRLRVHSKYKRGFYSLFSVIYICIPKRDKIPKFRTYKEMETFLNAHMHAAFITMPRRCHC